MFDKEPTYIFVIAVAILWVFVALFADKPSSPGFVPSWAPLVKQK